jgi:hypothetical protein
MRCLLLLVVLLALGQAKVEGMTDGLNFWNDEKHYPMDLEGKASPPLYGVFWDFD